VAAGIRNWQLIVAILSPKGRRKAVAAVAERISADAQARGFLGSSHQQSADRHTIKFGGALVNN
jgi:hypothetical protein